MELVLPNLTLTCPTCRQVTSVPASGVAGLQSEFRTSQLVEALGEKSAATSHIEEKVRSAPVILPLPGCREHNGRRLELYCITCEEPICYKCIKRDEKHCNHAYEELENAFGECKEEIRSMLETIESRLSDFGQRCSEICDQRAAIEAEIQNVVTPDQEKNELISQLHQLAQSKLEDLATQKDDLEIIQAQISSHQKMLDTGNHEELIKEVKKLTATLQREVLKHNVIADMVFSAIPDSTAKCRT